MREAVERQPGGGGGGGGGYGGGGGAGGGGGNRGAPSGPSDGGPMRDRRADFSGAPPAPGGFDSGGGAEVTRPVRRRDAPSPRRERDYEPRKRGFDDDQ